MNSISMRFLSSTRSDQDAGALKETVWLLEKWPTRLRDCRNQSRNCEYVAFQAHNMISLFKLKSLSKNPLLVTVYSTVP